MPLIDRMCRESGSRYDTGKRDHAGYCPNPAIRPDRADQGGNRREREAEERGPTVERQAETDCDEADQDNRRTDGRQKIPLLHAQ